MSYCKSKSTVFLKKQAQWCYSLTMVLPLSNTGTHVTFTNPFVIGTIVIGNSNLFWAEFGIRTDWIMIFFYIYFHCVFIHKVLFVWNLNWASDPIIAFLVVLWICLYKIICQNSYSICKTDLIHCRCKLMVWFAFLAPFHSDSQINVHQSTPKPNK